jgi:hypothetical protein
MGPETAGKQAVFRDGPGGRVDGDQFVGPVDGHQHVAAGGVVDGFTNLNPQLDGAYNCSGARLNDGAGSVLSVGDDDQMVKCVIGHAVREPSGRGPTRDTEPSDVDRDDRLRRPRIPGGGLDR